MHSHKMTLEFESDPGPFGENEKLFRTSGTRKESIFSSYQTECLPDVGALIISEALWFSRVGYILINNIIMFLTAT